MHLLDASPEVQVVTGWVTESSIMEQIIQREEVFLLQSLAKDTFARSLVGVSGDFVTSSKNPRTDEETERREKKGSLFLRSLN